MIRAKPPRTPGEMSLSTRLPETRLAALIPAYGRTLTPI
jgi:hypothetical protein